MQPKICTKWLHTLTWLNDVRSGVTPSTSPIPRYALYLPPAQSKYAHTHTHTYRFPFPELCFENRSFILTVNSQADRYSQSILSTIKPLSEYLRGTHVTAAPCHRGGASRIITHTHEECRITYGRRIRWYDVAQMVILLFRSAAFSSLYRNSTRCVKKIL